MTKLWKTFPTYSKVLACVPINQRDDTCSIAKVLVNLDTHKRLLLEAMRYLANTESNVN